MHGRITVLLVDDEPELREVVRHALTLAPGSAFEVVGAAGDGEQAIVAAGALQPDIVLLDLVMPATTGEAALPHILSVSPRSMVAVFTAVTAPDLPQRLASLGAFACYHKREISQLAQQLEDDHARFRRALAGDQVAVRWSERSVS